MLGWGGWWFWDPVENASFMPWLVATALIHSLAVTEKRNSFKSWTVLLAILAFSLSLLGTFLVRSGVLSSVHAFATDPRRGLFILAFLVVVIGSSLSLFAWRAPTVGLGARFALLSRETLLLGNNVLLVVACGAVLLGTLYPLAARRDGARQDLGRAALLRHRLRAAADTARLPDGRRPAGALEGSRAARPRASPALGRRRERGRDHPRRLVEGRRRHRRARVGLLMAAWIVFSLATDLIERLRPAGGLRTSVLHRARQIPRAMIGMMVAHLGIAVFIFGVTMVRTGEVERDVKMDVGDTTETHGKVFTFRGRARSARAPTTRRCKGRSTSPKAARPWPCCAPKSASTRRPSRR